MPVPDKITNESLHYVRDNMLVGSPAGINPALGQVGDNLYLSDCYRFDFSLTCQLPGLLEFDPETILFTAYSAIPVADVFRGTYEALERTSPRLESIYMTYPSGITVGEAERLKPDITGRRVAVVDQLIETGNTIRMALRSTNALSPASIYPVAGQWYHQADRSDLNVSRMTSVYAGKLQDIGKEVVKFAA